MADGEEPSDQVSRCPGRSAQGSERLNDDTTGSVGSVRAFAEKQALTVRKPGASSARTSSKR